MAAGMSYKGKNSMDIWKHLESEITDATGRPFVLRKHHGVAGGGINQTRKLEGEPESFFLKLNQRGMLDMFAAEAEGLNELSKAEAIRVPRPICWGEYGENSYIVLEHLNLAGREGTRRFGRQLAKLHGYTSEQCGWHRDNTIGLTPQINTWNDDWIDFWRQRRLGFQLNLAQQKGAGKGVHAKGGKLMEVFPRLFDGYSPKASVLHGDLWSGNWGGDEQGDPVIFDPAVYFGDHETDLAMMELFGSPGADFLPTYQEVFPIDSGYSVRKNFYNLYHILNHFNLFGGGYARQAEDMIDQLLAEIV
jgi:fructosamine-3-kinase